MSPKVKAIVYTMITVVVVELIYAVINEGKLMPWYVALILWFVVRYLPVEFILAKQNGFIASTIGIVFDSINTPLESGFRTVGMCTIYGTPFKEKKILFYITANKQIDYQNIGVILSDASPQVRQKFLFSGKATLLFESKETTYNIYIEELLIPNLDGRVLGMKKAEDLPKHLQG